MQTTKDLFPKCRNVTCKHDAAWAVRGDKIMDEMRDVNAEAFYCGNHLTTGIRYANWHSSQHVQVREL